MICSKQYSSASQKGKVIKAERRGPTSPIPFSSLWIAMRTAYRRPCRTISYPRGNLSSQAHQVYCLSVCQVTGVTNSSSFSFFFLFVAAGFFPLPPGDLVLDPPSFMEETPAPSASGAFVASGVELSMSASIAGFGVS